MIKIGTEKVVVQGRRYRRITELRALRAEDLPIEYVRGYPTVYIKGERIHIYSKPMGHDSWAVGDQIDDGTFNKCMDTIRMAGLRLHGINEWLKEELAA